MTLPDADRPTADAVEALAAFLHGLWGPDAPWHGAVRLPCSSAHHRVDAEKVLTFLASLRGPEDAALVEDGEEIWYHRYEPDPDDKEGLCSECSKAAGYIGHALASERAAGEEET